MPMAFVTRLSRSSAKPKGESVRAAQSIVRFDLWHALLESSMGGEMVCSLSVVRWIVQLCVWGTVKNNIEFDEVKRTIMTAVSTLRGACAGNGNGGRGGGNSKTRYK